MDVQDKQRHIIESILALQNKVFDRIVNNHSLKDIMKTITEELDLFFQRKTYGSILLLDSSGSKLFVGAAPNLPQEYNEWVHNKPIGPKACSCGTAVYREEMVIVSDISTSPLWEEFRSEALRFGLQSCWSIPIFIGSQVVGAFAMYHMEPRTPTGDEIQLIKACSHIVGLAMQREQKEKEAFLGGIKAKVIAEHAMDLVCTVDRDGIVTYGSSSHEEILGYATEEYQGVCVFDLVHPEDLPDAIGVFQQMIQQTQTAEVKLRYRHKRGHYIMIHVKGKSVVDPRGEIDCVVLIAQDITTQMREKQQLEEREQQYRSLFNHHPDAVYSIDMHGHIFACNKSLEKILGYKEWEYLQSFLSFIAPEYREKTKEYFQKALQGEPQTYETVGIHKQGYSVNLQTTNVPIIVNGVVTGVFGIAKDITRQKQMEQDILVAKQDLENMISRQQGLTFKVRKENEKSVFSLAGGELLSPIGLSAKDMLGKSLEEFLPLAVTKDVTPFHQRAWAGEEVMFEGELRGIRYVASLKPVIQDGEVIEVIASCMDITQRKHAEEKLKRSEARYRKLVEFSPEGIVVHRDGVILYINKAGMQLIKAEHENVIGSSIYQFIHPDSHEISINRIVRVQREEELPPVEIKLLQCNEKSFFAEVTSMQIDYEGESAILTLFRDITERRKIEGDLRESEQRYRRLVELSPEPILVHSAGNILYANPACVNVLRANSETELLGRSVLDFVHPDSLEVVIERMQHVAIEGNTAEFIEEKIIRLDGEIGYIEVGSVGIVYGGKPAIQLMIRDISERKCMEEELRQTKEMLESFMENNSDVIAILDLQGNVLKVNHAFEKMYGWTKEEVMNRELPNVPLEKEDELQQIVEKVKKGSFISGFETIRQRKDGSVIDVSLTYSPVRDQNDKIIAFSFISRDITERKKKDELLRKSDRLAVIGQLAAAVAHEIRNPLMSLKGFVQLLREKGEQDLYNSIMLEELNRIEMISNEFLILAKPQARIFKPHDIRTILHGVITLAEIQGLMSNVQIVTELEVDLPLVLSDDTQLKQVFLNVIKNAIEAMPNGGRIQIQLQQHDTGYLLIRFIDEGCGISGERLRHIGEPFYSTKEKGTGLGLMVSYKILQEHQGKIEIESQLGKGTCVTIFLPVISELGD